MYTTKIETRVGPIEIFFSIFFNDLIIKDIFAAVSIQFLSANILHPLEITRPKLSIEDNYNDDFLPVHQTILDRLRKKNDKGLVLLHGKPGTGKT